ncbi:hypothetical protein [Halpernia sp. GG3]
MLESSNLAMVLPTVSDVANIPSPSPGMMVYVNKTGAKRSAVYNGSNWSFFKPLKYFRVNQSRLRNKTAFF